MCTEGESLPGQDVSCRGWQAVQQCVDQQNAKTKQEKTKQIPEEEERAKGMEDNLEEAFRDVTCIKVGFVAL
jgi:hypothetical protein